MDDAVSMRLLSQRRKLSELRASRRSSQNTSTTVSVGDSSQVCSRSESPAATVEERLVLEVVCAERDGRSALLLDELELRQLIVLEVSSVFTKIAVQYHQRLCEPSPWGALQLEVEKLATRLHEAQHDNQHDNEAENTPRVSAKTCEHCQSRLSAELAEVCSERKVFQNNVSTRLKHTDEINRILREFDEREACLRRDLDAIFLKCSRRKSVTKK